MLLAGYACQGHSRSQSVHGNLRQPAGVFVRDHAGGRPRQRTVLGQKRTPSLQKISVAISLVRPLALGDFLEGIRNQETIESRFAAEEAGFAQVVVVREMAPPVGSGRGSD